MGQVRKADSSVLFSLNELRSLEQQRIAAEVQRQRDREEAEARARADQARAIIEAEAASRAAALAAAQAEARAAELRLVEEARRIAEAEARARADAHAGLEATRLAEELALARTVAARKRPIKLLAVTVAAVLAVAAVVVWSAVDRARTQENLRGAADDARARAEQAAAELDAKVAMLAAQVEADQLQLAEFDRRLAAAQTAADRKRLEREAEDAKQRALDNKRQLDTIREKKRVDSLQIDEKRLQYCIDHPLADRC